MPKTSTLAQQGEKRDPLSAGKAPLESSCNTLKDAKKVSD